MLSPDQARLHQLAQAHGFRLDALPDNRAGMLSNAQANLLGQKRRGTFWVLLLLSIFLCGGGLVMAVSSPDQFLPALLCVALGVFLSLATLRWLVRTRKAGRQVASVESFLRVRIDTRDDYLSTDTNPPSYFYETDAGLSFQVPQRATDLIDPGQRYRLYYSVGGKELVNIELVGGTFSAVPSPALSVGAASSASPYHLSAEEVSAIVGFPVTPFQSTPLEAGLTLPGMTFVSYANLALMMGAGYGFRLGGQHLRSSQKMEAMIRRTSERIPGLGDEAYFFQNRALFVYRGDVLLMAAVVGWQSNQLVADRQRTLALTQVLLQKLTQ